MGVLPELPEPGLVVVSQAGMLRLPTTHVELGSTMLWERAERDDDPRCTGSVCCLEPRQWWWECRGADEPLLLAERACRCRRRGKGGGAKEARGRGVVLRDT